MIKVNARTIDFFDRYVSRMIVKKYGFESINAIRSFIESETYQMLIDRELELYTLSPHIIFDMWESERITGDPRNSQYIRAEYE